MATIEVSLSDEELQALMQGDRGLRDLMTAAYNEVLEAEMTEHLGAGPKSERATATATIPARW